MSRFKGTIDSVGTCVIDIVGKGAIVGKGEDRNGQRVQKRAKKK